MVENNNNRLEVFQFQADLCKALSDPKRLRIIHELRDGPKSVTEIARLLGLKQSNTSQHLSVMRNVGIVIPRREQNTVYYSLFDPKIAEACDLVRGIIIEKLKRNQSLTGSIIS